MGDVSLICIADGTPMAYNRFCS